MRDIRDSSDEVVRPVIERQDAYPAPPDHVAEVHSPGLGDDFDR